MVKFPNIFSAGDNKAYKLTMLLLALCHVLAILLTWQRQPDA